jgi:hypothetical protein
MIALEGDCPAAIARLPKIGRMCLTFIRGPLSFDLRPNRAGRIGRMRHTEAQREVTRQIRIFGQQEAGVLPERVLQSRMRWA